MRSRSRTTDPIDAIAYTHRVDGLTYAAIAYQLGISESTARRAVRREAERRINTDRAAKGKEPI
jgi:transposase